MNWFGLLSGWNHLISCSAPWHLDLAKASLPQPWCGYHGWIFGACCGPVKKKQPRTHIQYPNICYIAWEIENKLLIKDVTEILTPDNFVMFKMRVGIAKQYQASELPPPFSYLGIKTGLPMDPQETRTIHKIYDHTLHFRRIGNLIEWFCQKIGLIMIFINTWWFSDTVNITHCPLYIQ